MIFNSTPFIIFFVVVFSIYYFPLKENTKAQNWLLLLSSYFFYGYADWKMIPLLLVATIINYFLGIAIKKANDSKKSSLIATLGVLTGVGLLVYFKYLNFLIDSFSSLLDAIGLKSNIGTFNILMPIGISFFTFKLISYIIEIHRGKIEPSRDFVAFSTYIAFFPTILSGPIDRPNSFIPQLQKKRSFDYDLVVDGCRQILWGLFQKVVIADNFAIIINNVWGDIPGQSGSVLFITAILYSIQIYTDFSGYSHMAIGLGKILGFRVTINFDYPFFSRNIAEYWRKWHISLTSWLTDYVFMPLNIKFRDIGVWGTIIAIIITFILIGLWHGANYTFAVFGLFHGLLYIPLILSGSIFKKKKLKTNKYGLPTLSDFFKIIITFMLVSFGLVIFRAEEMGQFFIYISKILSPSLFSMPKFIGMIQLLMTIIIAAIFVLAEWKGRSEEFAISHLGVKLNIYSRWSLYIILIILIYIFKSSEQEFIYFQF